MVYWNMQSFWKQKYQNKTDKIRLFPKYLTHGKGNTKIIIQKKYSKFRYI